MLNLQLQLVSRETVKPSSPTPENLRHLQLSLLDQLAPSINVPVTLFYSRKEIGGISDRLKRSLSELLTCFYPLAGRIKVDATSGYLQVECNDEGVDFYEVRVDCRLNEFLKHPSTSELNRIVSRAVSNDVPLTVQFSIFSCGGIAIGTFLSHKVVDGTSANVIVTVWAEATRRGGDFLKQVSPRFDFAMLFPPRAQKPWPKRISTKREKLVTKPFLFEASKIEVLREKAKTEAGFSPTKVEAMSAHIWRCAMRARGEAAMQRRPVAAQAVNIRGKMKPKLPKYSFGNLSIPVFAISDLTISDCLTAGMGYLEGLFRESVEKLNVDHVRQVLDNDHGQMVTSDQSSWKVLPEDWEKDGFDFCLFSSWLTFPFNKTDFGWGMPEWFGCSAFEINNVVILNPTSNGGIESWVTMVEEEMTRFEQDPHLLECVSLKPITSYNIGKLPLVEAKL